jgi:hypothetical protein
MIYFASACSINLSLCCCFFLMCVPIIACCGVVTLQDVVPILGCYMYILINLCRFIENYCLFLLILEIEKILYILINSCRFIENYCLF